LREYRQRAVQALHARDDELLKRAAGQDGSTGGSGGDGGDGGASGASSAEAASSAALTAAREEIRRLQGALADAEDTRALLEDAAAHTSASAEAEAAEASQALAAAEARAADAEKRAADAEGLAARNAAATDAALADLAQHRVQSDAELASLRRRLTRSQPEEELHARVSALTEHLVAKQTRIATLQAEKAALTHETSRLRATVQQQQQQQSHSAQSGVSGHSGGGGLSGGGGQAAAGRGRPQRDDFVHFVDIEAQSVPVRRVATTVDAIGLTLARGIRRSPAFRVGLLAYVVLLHAWVYYFLAFFEREHHPASFTKNNH
jgi:hypothetical protein